MRTYKWTWHGVLKPCPRPKVARRGGTYYPSHYMRHLNELRAWFDREVAQIPLPANARYRLKVVIHKCVDPVAKRYGDLDNLLKTVMDIFPFDDARITSIEAHKLACEKPSEQRVELHLTIVGNYYDEHAED